MGGSITCKSECRMKLSMKRISGHARLSECHFDSCLCLSSNSGPMQYRLWVTSDNLPSWAGTGVKVIYLPISWFEFVCIEKHKNILIPTVVIISYAISLCTRFSNFGFRSLFQTWKKIEFKTNLIFFRVRTWFLLPV